MAETIIAVDGMGGDKAPDMVIDGVFAALRENIDLKVLLTGPKELLEEKTQGLVRTGRLTIIDAPEIITMHDAPVQAVRKKKNSSLVMACDLVKQGQAKAAISAGSTGALMAAGVFVVGRMKGIERPALAAILPTLTGSPVVLLDVGANADCQPQHMAQFALMGAGYAKSALSIENPRVGLINIGEEAEKGNMLTKAAYAKIKELNINFTGSCEARDLLSGGFDVVVADGFTGNIALKSIEGTAFMMTKLLKGALMGSFKSKIGAALAKPALKEFKGHMDYNQYGGGPLLGLNGILIKIHGASTGETVKAALKQASQMVEGDLTGLIRGSLADLREDAE